MKALKERIPDLELVLIEGATHAGETGAMHHPTFLKSIHHFLLSNKGNKKY